ncbi:MAG: nitrilase [Firmicutes bacterium]|nr:nitrilase [Bacillota bacterium]
MKQIRIALVQMRSPFADLKNNLKKISRLARDAAAQEVDIICYPELCLQGYSRTESCLHAQPIPGPYTEKILALAQTYKLTMLVGLAEQTEYNKPYITHFVAYPDGKWDLYRKTHLGSREKPYFLPGQELPVFRHKKANFGILICWDLRFPEAATILSLKGAEIIFAPHASPMVSGNRRRSTWLKYLPARAYDNTVFIATCNLVGSDGTGRTFCGGALIIDPKGNVLAESFQKNDHLLVTDLYPRLINSIRRGKSTSMRSIFYLNVRRPELYTDLVR